MNTFPLSPFLASLTADGFHITLRDYERIILVLNSGGTWDMARLKGVLLSLLVRDPDHEEKFLRIFDSFFRESLIKAPPSHIDIRLVLAELRRLANSPQKPSLTQRINQRLTSSRSSGSSEELKIRYGSFKPLWLMIPKLVWIMLATLGFISTGMFLLFFQLWNDPLGNKTTTTGFWTIVDSMRNFSMEGVIVILMLIISLTSLFLFLWAALNSSAGSELFWNPYAPRLFSLGAIGGKPSPQIDASKMDYIADSMSYFQSQLPDKSLDISATVEASSRNYGWPTLVFRKKKQLRTVLILEDAYSESLVWNTSAKELADGLIERGVPVLYGKFHGSLSQFRTSDGSVYRFDDLDDERNKYLLLIFTDGKGIQRHSDTFILESLSRWPQVAWMELRETTSWDDTTAIPVHYGIPVYPASSKGLVAVVRRYLKEEWARNDFSEDADDWKGIPAFIGGSLGVHLEYLLGDVLPWAQECAMIQPVSIGMADALRRRFRQNLPPERLGRLFILPGTIYGAAGINFSKPVLTKLRSGFKDSRSKDEQEDVLKFILKEVDKTEPADVDSLAHLTWEWTRERVRFELNPRMAYKRLEELARSPLSESIIEDLKQIIPPDLNEGDSIWELENSYRRANQLFKSGELDAALGFIERRIALGISDTALLTLKERIENTKRMLQSPGSVSFYEQQSGSLGKEFVSASALHRVNAEYPSFAKENQVVGLVVVQVAVDENGDVTRTTVLQGPMLLRDAAQDAASQWTYQPAMSAGRPVATTQIIVFNFRL